MVPIMSNGYDIPLSIGQPPQLPLPEFQIIERDYPWVVGLYPTVLTSDSWVNDLREWVSGRLTSTATLTLALGLVLVSVLGFAFIRR